MIFILVGLIGLVFGSFLNVVIVRYPHMLMREWRSECLELLELEPESKPSAFNPTFNLIIPRSQCPHCKHRLAIWHNIPLLSYALLRGRCAYCQKKISWLYPLVELITAVTTLFIFFQFGLSFQTIFLCIFTWGLIILAMIDWRNKILPDTITLSLLWIGLIVNIKNTFVTLELAVLGAVVGYLFLWIVTHIFKLIRKKQGMGHGDFKMMAMLGAWLGVFPLLNILIISVFISLTVTLILLAFKKIHRDQPLPFGPYLALAGWLTLMFNNFFLLWLIKWF